MQKTNFNANKLFLHFVEKQHGPIVKYLLKCEKIDPHLRIIQASNQGNTEMINSCFKDEKFDPYRGMIEAQLGNCVDVVELCYKQITKMNPTTPTQPKTFKEYMAKNTFK